MSTLGMEYDWDRICKGLFWILLWMICFFVYLLLDRYFTRRRYKKKEPKPIKAVSGLCACGHTRHCEEICFWSFCPLEGGGHTEFSLMRCADCGKVCGFSQYNFELALREGTENTKLKLQEIIYASTD